MQRLTPTQQSVPYPQPLLTVVHEPQPLEPPPAGWAAAKPPSSPQPAFPLLTVIHEPQPLETPFLVELQGVGSNTSLKPADPFPPFPYSLSSMSPSLLRRRSW